MAEHHVSHKDAKHEDCLREVLQPLFVAHQVPLWYDRFFKDTAVVVEVGTVGVADIIEFIVNLCLSACEVHGRCEEYDAHLMPGHWEFDKEYHEANPYLPFPESSDGFRQRILFHGLVLNVFLFSLQHWKQLNKILFNIYAYLNKIAILCLPSATMWL